MTIESITTYALNESGDIYLDEAGNIATLVGVSAVVQNIKNKLLTFQGELIYDQEGGIAYQKDILNVTQVHRQLVEEDIKVAVLSVEGVSSVDQISLEIIDGSLTCYLVVLLDGGELTALELLLES